MQWNVSTSAAVEEWNGIAKHFRVPDILMFSIHL
jgi:hypothetical protein